MVIESGLHGCPLCGNKQPTIYYTLSNYPEAIQHGRYTWRHNCALKALVRGIKNHLDPDMDLPGLQAAENQLVTLPASPPQPAHADMIIKQKDITLIGLTILRTYWRLVCPMFPTYTP